METETKKSVMRDYPFMKSVIQNASIALIIILSISFVFFHRKAVVTYKDNYVVAGKLVSTFDSFSPHTTVEKFVTVGGRTYKGVQGFEPYYLAVPELNSILLVTLDNQKQDNQLHIINLSSKEDVTVAGLGTYFGSQIRNGNPPHSDDSDFLESIDQHQLVLARAYPDVTILTVVDTDKRTVLETRRIPKH